MQNGGDIDLNLVLGGRLRYEYIVICLDYGVSIVQNQFLGVEVVI